MINPLRRLLYELFLLPPLRFIEDSVGVLAAAIHSVGRVLHLEKRAAPITVNKTFLMVVFAAVILLAPAAGAQRTPPYFPSGTGNSQTQDRREKPEMPPDTKAPPREKLSTEEVQQQIQNKVDDEPMLKGMRLLASVDDDSVTLSGKVKNDDQRNLALRIAESYAGGRKIIDTILLSEPAEPR